MGKKGLFWVQSRYNTVGGLRRGYSVVPSVSVCYVAGF